MNLVKPQATESGTRELKVQFEYQRDGDTGDANPIACASYVNEPGIGAEEAAGKLCKMSKYLVHLAHVRLETSNRLRGWQQSCLVHSNRRFRPGELMNGD
jgi:hypothetical protein